MSESYSNYRIRRLVACRAAEQLRAVIDHIGVDDGLHLPPGDGPLPAPPTEAMRNEMKNIATALLRQILIFNDGHVSPSKLQAF